MLAQAIAFETVSYEDLAAFAPGLNQSVSFAHFLRKTYPRVFEALKAEEVGYRYVVVLGRVTMRWIRVIWCRLCGARPSWRCCPGWRAVWRRRVCGCVRVDGWLTPAGGGVD